MPLGGVSYIRTAEESEVGGYCDTEIGEGKFVMRKREELFHNVGCRRGIKNRITGRSCWTFLRWFYQQNSLASKYQKLNSN